MNEPRTLLDVYFRWQSKCRRLRRWLFPSPAEMKLIELMGGKVLRLNLYKFSPSAKYPLAIVLNRGRLFRRERIRREVRCGRYYMDFGNDIGRAIEVDGTPWHMDVVADYDREVYMYANGWRLLRIKAPRLWNDADRVQAEVLKFLTE